jgi:hypothetical protein
MHIVLWNGFANKLEVFRGDEEAAARLADIHRETGDNAIYFWAVVESIELKVM